VAPKNIQTKKLPKGQVTANRKAVTRASRLNFFARKSDSFSVAII
jgi:hypothetical protein